MTGILDIDHCVSLYTGLLFQMLLSEEDRGIVLCPKKIALFMITIICVTLDVIGENVTGRV
jgi:hypothetical protein